MKELVDTIDITKAIQVMDNTRNGLVRNGISVPVGTNPLSYGNMMDNIRTEGGGTPAPTAPYGVNPTWIDLKKAMEEDTNGYNLKFGMVLMNDEVSFLAKYTVSGGVVGLITTSDGGHYTTFNNTHVWDTSKDVQSYVNGVPSIKTRWIIVHLSNTTPPTANLSATLKDNAVYGIYDGLQLDKYSVYNKQRVRTITMLNGAKFHSSITDFTQSFYGMSDLMAVDDSMGLSHGIVFYQTFLNCVKLEYFQSSAKPTDVRSMFQGCVNLESIEMDLTNCDQTSGFLTNCVDICNLKLKGLKVSTTLASGTSYGAMLSQESLHYIIDNMQTVSGQTLTIGATNKAKIDAEHLATATAKGWTIN